MHYDIGCLVGKLRVQIAHKYFYGPFHRRSVQVGSNSNVKFL